MSQMKSRLVLNDQHFCHYGSSCNDKTNNGTTDTSWNAAQRVLEKKIKKLCSCKSAT